MIRVAPFASVKSVSAHIVLHTVGGCGFGIGMSWSSAWIGCGGLARVDGDRRQRRDRGSRGRARPRRSAARWGAPGCCSYSVAVREQVVDAHGVRGPRSSFAAGAMPSSCSSRSRSAASASTRSGLDRVLDDRVALLGDLWAIVSPVVRRSCCPRSASVRRRPDSVRRACRSTTTPSAPSTAAPPTSHDFEGKATRRQRGVEVRADAAVRGPGEAPRAVRGQGFTVLGVPVQPVHGPGAGHGRGDPDVLLDDLRRHVPAIEKIEVNGDDRHPLYAELDADGRRRGPHAATSGGTSRSSSSRPAARSSPASPRRSSPRPPSWSRPSRAAPGLIGPATVAGARHASPVARRTTSMPRQSCRSASTRATTIRATELDDHLRRSRRGRRPRRSLAARASPHPFPIQRSRSPTPWRAATSAARPRPARARPWPSACRCSSACRRPSRAIRAPSCWCPTRELAVQVHEVLEPLGKARDVRVAAVYGGADAREAGPGSSTTASRSWWPPPAA